MQKRRRGRRGVVTAIVASAAGLVGCAGAGHRAPTSDRSMPAGAVALAAADSSTAIRDAVEVDHVFLVTGPGAPEVAALRAAGLRIGERPTRHVGDGTASVGAIFQNAYLELVYLDSTVSDSALSSAERAQNARLFGWRESGVSPVGVGLRRRSGAPDALPFPSEAVERKPWMPPGPEVRRVTSSADSVAPRVFVVPREMAMTGWDAEAVADSAFVALLQHPLGVRRVTGVRVVVARPEGNPPSLQRLHRAGVLQVEPGPSHLLELTFDGGGTGATKDFRPELPLVIRY